MSKLYFKHGAMSCGKTALLLQVAHNYDERKLVVKVFKPLIDSKGEENIVSRIGIKRKADYLINGTKDLKRMLDICYNENTACILVDESQFLSKEEVDELFLFTKKYDIPVICYGLRTDFKTECFTGSKRLFELADEIEELVTICRCGKKAKFNGRIVNGEFVNDGEQIAIDGEASTAYESLCGKCYLEKVLNIDLEKE